MGKYPYKPRDGDILSKTGNLDITNEKSCRFKYMKVQNLCMEKRDPKERTKTKV